MLDKREKRVTRTIVMLGEGVDFDFVIDEGSNKE